MKADTYYLLFFTILFTGQYFCLKHEIIENFLWMGFIWNLWFFVCRYE